MDDTTAVAPEATASQDAPAPSVISDASQAYERWDFQAASEETAEAKATEPSKDAPPQEPTAATPAKDPEPPGDGLSDEEIERILADEKVKQRIDRLADNKVGNRLQAAREEERRRIAEESKQWDTATDYFNRLVDDEDFYAAQVAEFGEGRIGGFKDAYKASAQERAGGDVAPAVDADAIRRDFAKAFNDAAVGEFQTIVKGSLPFYGDLPEDVRKTIESAAYDPNGNWLHASLTAIGTGVTKHIEGLERKHAQALREAMTAGTNDAIAAREESAPVVVNGQQGQSFGSWAEIESAYANGSITRAQWQKALSDHGKTI